ncbi:hypothetical protein D3C71_1263230 [compost metagenome]
MLEVHPLTQHRTDAGRVEDQPGHCFPAPDRILWNQPAMAFGQIQQDGGGFEQGHATRLVHQYRNAPVRVQLQEFRRAMLALLDTHMVQLVIQRKLFQRDGGLVAVGRTVGIQMQRRQ